MTWLDVVGTKVHILSLSTVCGLTLNFEELSARALIIRTSKRHTAALHISCCWCHKIGGISERKHYDACYLYLGTIQSNYNCDNQTM